MRQVPKVSSQKPYLIIGSGRLARHLACYFDYLRIPFLKWNRGCEHLLLEEIVCDAGTVLLAISDHAIEDFIRNNVCLRGHPLVHFSGALYTPLAFGAHPLMTFAEGVYSESTYRQFSFVLDADAPAFNELFPKLENPHYRVPPALKALYHSWCVMSGNFSVLLWQKTFSELQDKIGISRTALIPYLKQITQNIEQGAASALTGPLVRGDQATIDRHFEALQGDPYLEVYQAFVNAYRAERQR